MSLNSLKSVGVPDGYEIVTSKDYLIKKGDIFKANNQWFLYSKHRTVKAYLFEQVATPIKKEEIQNNTNNITDSQDNKPIPPDGYVLLENIDKYILKSGDYFCREGDKWEEVVMWDGRKAASLKQYIQYVAVKRTGPAPKRFKCNKEYPYGY